MTVVHWLPSHRCIFGYLLPTNVVRKTSKKTIIRRANQVWRVCRTWQHFPSQRINRLVFSATLSIVALQNYAFRSLSDKQLFLLQLLVWFVDRFWQYSAVIVFPDEVFVTNNSSEISQHRRQNANSVLPLKSSVLWDWPMISVERFLQLTRCIWIIVFQIKISNFKSTFRTLRKILSEWRTNYFASFDSLFDFQSSKSKQRRKRCFLCTTSKLFKIGLETLKLKLYSS